MGIEEEINFTPLEQEIQSLISSYNRVVATNRLLVKKLDRVSKENALLLDMKKRISNKIKGLISSLKE